MAQSAKAQIDARDLQRSIDQLAQSIAAQIAEGVMHRALDKNASADPTAIGRQIGDIARSAAETAYGLHRGGKRRTARK